VESGSSERQRTEYSELIRVRQHANSPHAAWHSLLSRAAHFCE
jgi:hypothetical protein